MHTYTPEEIESLRERYYAGEFPAITPGDVFKASRLKPGAAAFDVHATKLNKANADEGFFDYRPRLDFSKFHRDAAKAEKEFAAVWDAALAETTPNSQGE